MGIRLRTPGSSLGSYCSGESAPMTGERASFSGRSWRTSGYSLRAARLPHVDVAQHRAACGLAAAIGASRPSRASVSVPFV